MKVLVLGASGFIGRAIANALSRAGHVVYAQSRSADKANEFARAELVPFIYEPGQQTEKLASLAKDLDVVIDTIGAFTPEVPLETFEIVTSAVKDRPVGAKLTYIYCGGSWVHSRGLAGLESITSETQPHSGQVALTSWRWQVESRVLSSTVVHGTVIRPGVLHGYDGSYWAMFVFGPALAAAKAGAKFNAFSKEDFRFPSVHTDDLADLFVRAAERGHLCAGQAFVGANPMTERYTDVLDAVARVSGAKGYNRTEPDAANPMEQAWANSTTRIKPTLGESLLGWRPKKMGLVDGMDLYWASYVASQAGKA